MWFCASALCAALVAGRKPTGVFEASLEGAPGWGTPCGSADKVAAIFEVGFPGAGAPKNMENFFFESGADILMHNAPGDVAMESGLGDDWASPGKTRATSEIDNFGPFLLAGGQRRNTEWNFKFTKWSRSLHTLTKKR